MLIPANVVYSYTEDPYFKDCFYWGEIKTVPIGELLKIKPDLTNEDLEEISKYSQAWYHYYNVAACMKTVCFIEIHCTLMYFNYKTQILLYIKRKNKLQEQEIIK